VSGVDRLITYFEALSSRHANSLSFYLEVYL